ncbi:MAG: hypothetical protein ACK5LR_10095 [Mangrovibacterium sp.]
MKLAAHYSINEHGESLRGGMIEIVGGKIADYRELGLPIPELAGMEFHSGVIVPAFPNLSACEAALQKTKQSNSAIAWLQAMPLRLQANFYIEWMLALQNADAQFNLKDAVRIFCCELPKLLQLDEIKLQLGRTINLWLVSGVDYQTFRLNNSSKLRLLI